jgi:hypothetical protein
MITTLKSIVSCEVWVWGIVSKEIFLGVHSLNHVNVPQHMKSLQRLEYVSSLCKSVSISPKTKGRDNNNVIGHV